jgi:hypothetical protein
MHAQAELTQETQHLVSMFWGAVAGDAATDEEGDTGEGASMVGTVAKAAAESEVAGKNIVVEYSR